MAWVREGERRVWKAVKLVVYAYQKEWPLVKSACWVGRSRRDAVDALLLKIPDSVSTLHRFRSHRTIISYYPFALN
jgi:hypothetical protein